jgi:hypothetical protein
LRACDLETASQENEKAQRARGDVTGHFGLAGEKDELGEGRIEEAAHQGGQQHDRNDESCGSVPAQVRLGFDCADLVLGMMFGQLPRSVFIGPATPALLEERISVICRGGKVV